MLPEQIEKDIDTQTSPKLSVIFPEHIKKATMESYLTNGLRGLEPPGKYHSVLLSLSYVFNLFKGFFLQEQDPIFVLV